MNKCLVIFSTSLCFISQVFSQSVPRGVDQPFSKSIKESEPQNLTKDSTMTPQSAVKSVPKFNLSTSQAQVNSAKFDEVTFLRLNELEKRIKKLEDEKLENGISTKKN